MSRYRIRRHKDIVNIIRKNENKMTEVLISEDEKSNGNVEKEMEHEMIKRNIIDENAIDKKINECKLTDNQIEEMNHNKYKNDVKYEMENNLYEDDEKKKDSNENNMINNNCEQKEKISKTSLVNYKTVTLCKNEPVKPNDLSKSLLVKLPVVISKFVLNVNCNAEIKFKEPVSKIKSSRENVYLTYCKLIPKANRLFFNGYVRKSIEYLTVKASKESEKETSTSQLTVYIPFEGVTEVSYSTPPILEDLENKKEIFCCFDDNLEASHEEANYRHEEYLCEKIFCELVKSDVFSSDVIDDKICEEHEYFNKIEEKLVLYLTLRLIQNQEISIN